MLHWTEVAAPYTKVSRARPRPDAHFVPCNMAIDARNLSQAPASLQGLIVLGAARQGLVEARYQITIVERLGQKANRA